VIFVLQRDLWVSHGCHIIEQIELQAKLLNYFLGSNKSNINQTNDCLEQSARVDCDFSWTKQFMAFMVLTLSK